MASSSSSDNMYAVLQETNGKEYESWLYFIKYTGNEEALAHLQEQLEKVDWYILDDLSTFDLDLDHLVSEKTASEMITLNLNHVSNHRKFDGKMQKIDLGVKEKYSNDKNIVRVFKKIGIGHLDEYIEDEDVFVHEVDSDDEDDYDSSGTEYEYDISDSSSSSDEEEEVRGKKGGKTLDRLKEEIRLRKEQKEREAAEKEKQKEKDKKREKERKEKEREKEKKNRK
jgi:hypothetical protein